MPRIAEGKIDRSFAQKVKKGDVIALYVKTSNVFLNIVRISDDWIPSKKIVRVDEKQEGRIKYPYQTSVDIIQEGVASIRELV